MALITIFETQNVTGFSLNSIFGAFNKSVLPMPFQLVDGEEYVIFWDRDSYTRTAFSFTGADGSTCVAVGNKMVSTGENDGDPFAIVCDYTNNYLHYFSTEDNAGHYVGVYQEEGSDIILKDHAGNDLDAIEGIVEIRIPTSDGGVQSFSSGTRVRTTIDPDFSEGDMVVTPNEGEVFNEVTIKKPEGLVSENIPKGITIAGVPGGLASGGNLDAYLNGSLVEISSEVQTLRGYAIYGDPNDPTIVSIDFPLLEKVGDYGIYNLCYLETLKVNRLESVGNFFLGSCFIISELEFPALKTVGRNFLSNCKALTKIDFGSLSNIPEGSFSSCSALTAVILRSQTLTTVQEYPTNTYGGPFGDNAAPNAYIYVPSDLLSTYKAATGWSRISSRIRAIEDYPDICG